MVDMRIAMISMHTSPLQQPGSGDAGGMNVYIASVAKEIAELGIEVDIFTRATRPSQGKVITVAPGLRVINIVAGPYEGLDKEELHTQLAAFSGGIITWVREEKIQYDLIHAHYWLSGQVGWLLRDLWQIPLVFTAHTLAAVKNQFRSRGDTAESEARRICEQQIVDNADALVVNTIEEKSNLIEHYDADEEKILIIAPGADISLYSPGTERATERARRELGIPLHTKVVAFVGRLQKFKGPDTLLEAISIIRHKEDAPNTRLIMCGGPSGQDASMTSYYALAKKLRVSCCVRFLEPRPPQELVAIYRAADIVAVPSYNESFGLVALEAQATGTPVVATRVGGLPTVVKDGETGLLVDGHDPHKWAEALISLLEDDVRRNEMAERAVEHASEFSWKHTAESLAHAYAEIIAHPHLDEERIASGISG